MRRASAWLPTALFASALLIAIVLVFRMTAPSSLLATPAYARRFDTQCATCHSPMPPRLNNVGILFRRFGFRLPDSDESGKLVLKTLPAHGIGDAFAVAADVGASEQPEADPGTSRSSLQFGEVALLGGTSIDDHLSAQMVFLPRNGEGSSELEDAELMANGGAPGSQFSARAGICEPFLWQKANHGSLTASLPLVFDESPAAPVGDFGGLQLGQNQTEVEAGYTFTKLAKGHVLATLLSAALLNGVTETGDAADRNPTDGADVLVQGLELIGSRNTLGGFYYHGRTVVDPLGELAPPGPFRERFDRYGAMGSFSPIDRLDILGSVVGGNDKSQQLDRTVNMLGEYVEVTGELMPHWVLVYRWDEVDPDRDTGGDLVRADVISSTYQLWDHLFLTAEWQQLRVADTKPHSILADIRLIY
ncbi:MAG TPA: hypothetical protein VFK69_03700 [Candidatus Eisenbacteria bacterium]|nr:hypothetical protein [Candidatus Eisenbacteria bacterium]